MSETTPINDRISIEQIYLDTFGKKPLSSLSLLDMVKAIKYHYEFIITNTPQSLYWKDVNAVYLGCSGETARICGLSKPSELIGLTDYDLQEMLNWPPGTADSFREDDLKVIHKGELILNEEEKAFNTASGKMIYQLSSRIPLKNEKNEIIGILGISTDVTDLKKAKHELELARAEADAANQMKTQFIQNMQHDLRTPLIGQCNMLEHVLKTETDPQRKVLFQHMYDSAAQLLNFCNDIVDLENINYLSNKVKREPVNIKYFLSQSIKLNKSAAHTSGLSLLLELDPNMPTYMMLDKLRMKRIFTNLIGNSIKFTKEGSITLKVSCLKKRKKDATILFEVIDTGIGIPSDKIHLVYDKLNKLEPSCQGIYKGSGLGLYFVKKFVEDLKGHIDIESERGNGTTIKLTLKTPLLTDEQLLAEERKKTEHLKNAPSSVKKSKNKNEPITSDGSAPLSVNESSVETVDKSPPNPQVLVIEDDQLAQWAICESYKNLGCDTVATDSVAGSKKMLSNQHFDLVSCDLGLIDGSGLEVMEWVVRNKKHPNQNTPFIAVTANSDSQKVQEALHRGFQEVLQKPFYENDAKRILNKYLILRSPKPSNIPEKIIDLTTLLNQHSNKKSPVEHILNLLQNTLPQTEAQLKLLATKNDIENSRLLMHTLKGQFEFCCVPRLQYYCQILQNEIKDSQKKNTSLTSLSKFYDDLFKEFQNFYNEYDSLRKNGDL